MKDLTAGREMVIGFDNDRNGSNDRSIAVGKASLILSKSSPNKARLPTSEIFFESWCLSFFSS